MSTTAPTQSATPTPEPGGRLHSTYRLAVVLVLGFASGLPLALSGQAMQAWLTLSGLDLATIGFLSLAGLPYTFKFLWAPLMDRFDLPWLGRRRGWMVLTQLALAAVLLLLAATEPKDSLRLFALLAFTVAFLSASQDVVVDAYRTDLLPAAERGMGSSMYVMGYRLAMIVSGGLALIWTDAAQGGGWTWPQLYRAMALVLAVLAVFSAVAVPRLAGLDEPASSAERANAAGGPQPMQAPVQAPTKPWRDVRGFGAVMLAAAIGVMATDRWGGAAARGLIGPLLSGSSLPATLQQRWVDLVALLLGLALTLPLAAWAARAAGFDTLLGGLRSYFSQRGAAAFLLLIVLYKLGDAFAVSLLTPFLLKAMAYSQAEVGVVNKLLGLWLTIGGALLGGGLMLRLGLWRALFIFGVLQLVSNLGYWWLAVGGKGSLPGIHLPAFDWGFMKLTQPALVDGSLLSVVALDNIAGGMGSTAHVALMMALCNRRFTATQFALLSAFSSVGRVWVGPVAGVLAETIGWPSFFIISMLVALPGLVLLWWLRTSVHALDAPAGPK